MDAENTLLNRVVAFIVTPIVTALSGFLVVFIEGVLETDLDEKEIAAIAVAVAVLAGAQCINWLRNLHDWQKNR